MVDILKNKKINKTPFRKEVLAIFSKYDNAIPLSVIEKELKEYNRITLYRTIKVFLEKKIIHEISWSGNVPNYAICEEQCDDVLHNHQHIHFKCKKCTTIFCVGMDEIPSFKLPKFKIEQVEIQVSGLCQSCNL